MVPPGRCPRLQRLGGRLRTPRPGYDPRRGGGWQPESGRFCGAKSSRPAGWSWLQRHNGMKLAIILEEAHAQFALEYDDTLGRKNRMRLEASTYLNAIREARSFLGIN